MFRCYCCASPHSARRYPELAKEQNDEENIPLQDRRTFGHYRSGSVLVPDDIAGLPSTQMRHTLASNPDPVLYEAEIDQGRGMRGIRAFVAVLTVFFLPLTIVGTLFKAIRGHYGYVRGFLCVS